MAALLWAFMPGCGAHEPASPESHREPTSARTQVTPTEEPRTDNARPRSAQVIVTGVLWRRGGAIEVCPGESVGDCPGIPVEGQVEEAWISEQAKVTVWRLSGSYDGTTLTLGAPAQPSDFHSPPSTRANQRPYPRAELERARTKADAILREHGVVWSSSTYDAVRNEVVYEAEAIDAKTLADLARISVRTPEGTLRPVGAGIRVVAFIELVDQDLKQMPVPPARGDVALITASTRRGGGRSALGRFTVHYDAALRCVYFDASGERVLPIWPYGFWATSSPFRVFDYDDKLVAQAGSALELGGGRVEVEHARAANPCGAKQAWIAHPQTSFEAKAKR